MLDRERRELLAGPEANLLLVHPSRESVAILHPMENDERPVPSPDPDPETVERLRRGHMRRALIFGVAMATIQMGALIYFMYC